MDGAVKGEEFDYFHDMIVGQEMTRANARGFQDGNMAGMTISLSAVNQFANDEAWKKNISDQVYAGKKKICLAITEAFAGSDVAGIRTTAVKTADGKHYIINGTKKWITNGTWCDYFVTGVKTDKGLSVILIERGEGVETTPIKTAYSAAAGTAYVTFDNVKVPVENLLGKENKGIYVILANFNHERWMMACKSLLFFPSPVNKEICVLTTSRRRHQNVPRCNRRMHEMGQPTPRLRQEAHGATRHPAKASQDDRTLRVEPSIFGKHHVPDVQHAVLATISASRWPHWTVEDVCDEIRA
jgi:hypothetical protein